MVRADFVQQGKFAGDFIAFDPVVDAARKQQSVPSMLVDCFAYPWNGAYLQPAKAGRACPGAVHSPRAIGDALTVRPLEPDVPGPHGNEIDQIYRLRIQRGKNQERIVGWLYNAVDGRWAFSSTDPNLTGTVLSISKPKAVTTESIVHWVETAARTVGVLPTSASLRMLNDPASALRVETCFDTAWNGAS